MLFLLGAIAIIGTFLVCLIILVYHNRQEVEGGLHELLAIPKLLLDLYPVAQCLLALVACMEIFINSGVPWRDHGPIFSAMFIALLIADVAITHLFGWWVWGVNPGGRSSPLLAILAVIASFGVSAYWKTDLIYAKFDKGSFSHFEFYDVFLYSLLGSSLFLMLVIGWGYWRNKSRFTGLRRKDSAGASLGD